jgi:diadenosine tetraphosphate (Ap4A) HIT family hydrolase
MNFGLNLGEAAAPEIAEHLHLHGIPRWNGDVLFYDFSWRSTDTSRDFGGMKGQLQEGMTRSLDPSNISVTP